MPHRGDIGREETTGDGDVGLCPRCGRPLTEDDRAAGAAGDECLRCRNRGTRIFALLFAGWALFLLAIAVVFLVASVRVLLRQG